MRVASLFTGAGGLDLGLHQVGLQRVGPCAANQCNNQQSTTISVPNNHTYLQAGHEIILQCEIDPGAQQVRVEQLAGNIRIVAGLVRKLLHASILGCRSFRDTFLAHCLSQMSGPLSPCRRYTNLASAR